jgi:hypothetical protein
MPFLAPRNGSMGYHKTHLKCSWIIGFCYGDAIGAKVANGA